MIAVMRNIRILFTLFAATVTSLCFGETVTAGPSGRVVNDEFFGMHVRYGTTRTRWPFAHFHGWRVITPETEWRGIQPERDTWNFSALDAAVRIASDNGVEMLLTLGQTPRWAASRPDEIVPNGPGASSEPRELADWETYVRTVARRYKGRIKYYELWNEPRFREVDPYRAIPGFTGYAPKLVELGRVAKAVLATEDPSAILISPAFDAGFVGLPRVEQWFKSDGGAVAPILSYHFYLRPPEKMVKLISELRAITARYGFRSMPIWNTESGYYVENPDRPTKPEWPGTDYVFAKVLTPEENAAFMVRAHLLTAAAGLDRFYWYSWDIANMGLTREFGNTQTIGSYAYGTMLRWLRGANIRQCKTTDNVVWVCNVTRNQEHAYIVWATDGFNVFQIPDDLPFVQAESIDGKVTTIEGRSIRIGAAPQLLRKANVPWLSGQ